MPKTISYTGTDDLRALEQTLNQAAEIAPRDARKIVSKGCLNIKTEWRRTWSGYPHAPRLPYSITYDTKSLPHGASGEVGPDKDKPQGPLGNLFEFGSVNNAPIPGGAPAAEREEPRLVKAAEDAALKALGW